MSVCRLYFACLAPLVAFCSLACSEAAAADSLSAAQILDVTGVRGGLVVHLGCGDGKLTAALRANDRFIVHGLDADSQNVEAARKHIRSLNLYGKVSVEQCRDQRLPYADNLVNLVVMESLGKVPMEEIMRVLAPNGVAWIGGKITVKPWPKEIDQWTHYLHGPDNNAVAHDSVVGPPKSVQWLEGPLWQRHHEMNANPNAMVSAQGRIFYINDEATATVSGLPDKWVLIARDAFNGTLLWKRPVPDWGWKAWSALETGGRFNLPIHTPRRLVAVGDRVYVTLGFNAPLTALDAATGEIVKTYNGTQFTDEILLDDGLLVLTVNEGPQQPDPADRRQHRKKSPPVRTSVDAGPAVKKRIAVLKADSGHILWTKDGFTGVSSSPISGHILRINRLLTAVGSGKVVCVEKDALIALDLNTGRQLWQTPRPPLAPNPPSLRENLLNFSTIVIHEDVVLFLQTDQSYELSEGAGRRGVRCTLLGLSADTGKVLWTRPCSKWGPASEGDVFVIGGLAWTHAPDAVADDFAVVGIDLHSGQIKQTFSTKETLDEVHHHRCFRNKATDRYLLTGRRGIETLDLDQGQITKNEWTRGACRYGIMPCNGLIYVPPHPCECYIDVKLSGFYALSSAAPKASLAKAPLDRGPAYSLISNPRSVIPAVSEWPTYRHDSRRSGATEAEVPARLARLWEARLDSRPSACTVAGGYVFAAAVEQHRVVALDASDGRTLWEYTAGGRVDTPPTVDGERVLFGSADGWVYCLRAADGVLAWRFQAAPDQRRVVVLGQLESAWPVHGTVLVNDGVAYVAAGRSTHLDGGIRLCALQAQSGALIRQWQASDRGVQGLEDVLVGDGDRVYMRQLEFRLKPQEKPGPPGPRAYSTAGLLDDSCFARVGWSTKCQIGNNGKAKGAKPADLLVFDRNSTFAFRTRREGGFGGWFQAAAGAYEITALDSQTAKRRWTAGLPVRVRAMAAAGRTLFAAGTRDVANPPDPWAAIEGRAGGLLWAMATADGKKLAELPLDAAPVWDGLSVAGTKLFLSTVDGKVMCLGATETH